ncbi:putative protein phosphatase 2C 25 [Prunus yedoensis var. nudiflora]|uniref:Uncharacterized protein n=1 Tax=Prunus yedoensis var. nudiflora TaxID=2094558 RepID=A0A314Z0E1_PRUYE|nr:putative protein phosphatase 2C 25 [Prunus yedoensis var. nudiflora]
MARFLRRHDLRLRQRLRVSFQRHEISGCKTEPSAERVDVVEVEEDDYSVYCKRGRRGPMEDRYSAVVTSR